jgi:predicted small metal-binding protein
MREGVSELGQGLVVLKRFACGAVVAGCMATFEDETEDALLARVAAHASEAHGITEVTPELVGQVREHIITVG